MKQRILRRVRLFGLGDEGSVQTLYLMMLPILIFGFLGLAWDGGRAVNTRANVHDVAQSAARAGATAVVQLDGSPPLLDPALAHERANALMGEYPDMTASVVATTETVTVTVSGDYDTDFLKNVGFATFTYTGTHVAELQIGVLTDGDSGA